MLQTIDDHKSGTLSFKVLIKSDLKKGLFSHAIIRKQIVPEDPTGTIIMYVFSFIYNLL